MRFLACTRISHSHHETHLMGLNLVWRAISFTDSSHLFSSSTEYFSLHRCLFVFSAGLRSCRKNETAPAPELLLFINMAPAQAPQLMVFMRITPAPQLFFFKVAPASACVRF